LVSNRICVPCPFSLTILIESGTIIKKMANKVHAGTLCCTEFGKISLLSTVGTISLNVMKLSCSKIGSSPSPHCS
jgi:hypothetical protein